MGSKRHVCPVWLGWPGKGKMKTLNAMFGKSTSTQHPTKNIARQQLNSSNTSRTPSPSSISQFHQTIEDAPRRRSRGGILTNFPPPKTATNITTLAAHLPHNQQLLPPRRQERPLAHLHDPLHALSIPFPAPLDIAIASQLAEPQTAVTREQPFLARERTRWVGPCGIDYGA
jgi:hypothetical protein